MPDHYHDETDMKLMREMRKLAPDDFNAWLGLNNIVGREGGAIPKKYRELMALAVSCTTQCPYCIEAHSKAAKAAGATREEVVEATLVAAAVRSGASATHGAMALKFFDQ
jgi:AhpD family alkylhydroperoxidase